MADMRVWTKRVDKPLVTVHVAGSYAWILLIEMEAPGALWDIMSLYIEGSERSLRANGRWPSALPFCTPGPMNLTKMPAPWHQTEIVSKYCTSPPAP